MGTLSDRCQHIFYGEVYLEGELLECELANQIVRIFRKGKTKYYIDMQKVACQVESMPGKRVLLATHCKSNSLSLHLSFKSGSKQEAFLKAYHLNETTEPDFSQT